MRLARLAVVFCLVMGRRGQTSCAIFMYSECCREIDVGRLSLGAGERGVELRQSVEEISDAEIYCKCG